MTDRFEDWQAPKIEHGVPTCYNWLVQYPEGLELGHGSDIGAFTYINARHGVEIGAGAQIGSHCSLYSVSTIDGKEGRVIIGEDACIGTHSTVMPGVKIGKNAVVGAHSFVNRDVPDGAMAYGVPAKIAQQKAEGAKSQNPRVFLSPPHMGGGEMTHVEEAFAANFIAPTGPQLEQFEREFEALTGFKHAVAVSSGTAAMHLAMHHLGIGRGDVVLASTLTFIGSVGPVVHLGGELRFVDSDRDTWTMDPELLEVAIRDCLVEGKRPKAVVPTDLYGQSCDLDRLRQICDPYDIPLIVDSAEAVGSIYRDRHAGRGAVAAVYSFNGNKIITTSGGGMLASDDDVLIGHVRKLASQSREPVSHFEHREVGYNFRMSNIAAAIGLGQLRVLSDRVRRKREISETYRRLLCDTGCLSFMPEANYGSSNCWLTVILVEGTDSEMARDGMLRRLESENIEARPVWKPMHLQPVFLGCKMYGGEVSEDLFRRGLCLPSGTSLDDDEILRIGRILKGE